MLASVMVRCRLHYDMWRVYYPNMLTKPANPALLLPSTRRDSRTGSPYSTTWTLFLPRATGSQISDLGNPKSGSPNVSIATVFREHNVRFAVHMLGVTWETRNEINWLTTL